MRRVLGIDPSSTAVGWAILEDRGVNQIPLLIDAGQIKPPRSFDADARMAFIASGVGVVCSNAWLPGIAVVAIETPGRRPAAKQAPAHMATYGRAVGLVDGIVRILIGHSKIVYVQSDGEWTRSGKESKLDRMGTIAAAGLYVPGPKGYEPGDSGFDKSDAIALAWWQLRRM